MPKALGTSTNIYVRNDPIKQNLTLTYDGPFLVRSRTNKTFKIYLKCNLSSVAITNTKAAFTLYDATCQLPFCSTTIPSNPN